MEALVEYNYEAQEPDELTIRKGDIIKDIKVSNGGWWEGTLRDKRGMFPDNFVKVLDPPGGTKISGDKTSKHEEVTLRNGSGRKFCRVLFSYEPCNDDELKLVPEEAIEYIGEVEEGWWRGRLKGRTGVFPSNFVSQPVPEEAERNKEKKELCRVLFPYEAANEDELTLVEGDIITLLSKDAPDKGWWKGELKGQIGLFPDNFVEVISITNNLRTDNQANFTDVITKNNLHSDAPGNLNSTVKSTAKNQIGKKKEIANIRKSLDTRINSRVDAALKKMSTSASASSLSGNTSEKKQSNALISGLKRLVGDGGNCSSNNGNGSIGAGLGEELDEVERGEGAPLSHLTASRAKAPRRRLPSTQHLRHTTSGSSPTGPNNNNLNILTEDNVINGSADVPESIVKEDESDGLVAKTRKKAPWVEELKLNQMERRKVVDRPDKIDIKKEKSFSWLPSSANNTDVSPKTDLETEEPKLKEKERDKSPRVESTSSSEAPALSPMTTPPAYVPYYLYSQLLDRVAALEEKQIVLQRKVNQLSEQLTPFIENATSDKD